MTPDPQPKVTFQDINRACDRWLMKNDPAFRAERQASRERLNRRNDRAAGKPVAESSNPGRVGFSYGQYADL